MNEKIVGYILLSLGVFLIFFALINMYLVFTKKIEPIKFFSSESTSQNTTGPLSFLQEKGISTPTALNFLSPRFLDETINLTSHIFLMGFVASIGQKLGSLGILLLRPIEVKVREQKVPIPERNNETI